MKPSHLAMAAWALCLGSAVLASGTTVDTTTTTTKGDEHVVIKVIRREGSGDGPHAGHAGAVNDNCASGTRLLDQSDEDEDTKGQKKRTRIILCSRGEQASGNIAARLTEARKRIEGDTSLSAETRAKVLDSLDTEIARAKASPSN